MFTYGDIRAFTPSEIGRMNTEIDRITRVIAQKQTDLDSVRSNPLNYLIETQRDAMTRMENGIAQDTKIGGQLLASRDDVIESGDTDRLQRWFDLAAAVGSTSDIQVWNEQRGFAQTSQMISTVASDTAEQIKNPFGVNWKLWAGGAILLYLFLGRRK